jgi:hydrogenase maturation protease
LSKILVLGLGNPILTDDGVGVYVVREVAARWRGDGVEFGEACVGGLRLLEVIAGCERLILVDAIQTLGATPGQIHRLAADDLRSSLHTGSTHDFSFQGALAWGRRMGMKLPPDDSITVIAVEVEDVLTFGETLTPAIAEALPRAVAAVLDELAGHMRG